MESSYKNANAKNYTDKKQVLDGFISVIKLLTEKQRSYGLKILMSRVLENVDQTVNIHRTISNIIGQFSYENNLEYLRKLVDFGRKNPKDGISFIDYTGSIIVKFDTTQRAAILDKLMSSYYNFFDQNLAKLKEGTDLFLPLLPNIKPEQQPKVIIHYYRIYRSKNYERERTIAQINEDHNQKINEIDNEYRQSINEIEAIYNQEVAKAEMEYQIKKLAKEKLRLKSLYGIGGGILVVVLIAFILVFFSIQRSLRKIEGKITEQ
ncbi:MAG: hypothetical protein ABII90_07640 [Bacteroidota bacterium]